MVSNYGFLNNVNPSESSYQNDADEQVKKLAKERRKLAKEYNQMGGLAIESTNAFEIEEKEKLKAAAQAAHDAIIADAEENFQQATQRDIVGDLSHILRREAAEIKEYGGGKRDKILDQANPWDVRRAQAQKQLDAVKMRAGETLRSQHFGIDKGALDFSRSMKKQDDVQEFQAEQGEIEREFRSGESEKQREQQNQQFNANLYQSENRHNEKMALDKAKFEAKYSGRILPEGGLFNQLKPKDKVNFNKDVDNQTSKVRKDVNDLMKNDSRYRPLMESVHSKKYFNFARTLKAKLARGESLTKGEIVKANFLHGKSIEPHRMSDFDAQILEINQESALITALKQKGFWTDNLAKASSINLEALDKGFNNSATRYRNDILDGVSKAKEAIEEYKKDPTAYKAQVANKIIVLVNDGISQIENISDYLSPQERDAVDEFLTSGVIAEVLEYTNSVPKLRDLVFSQLNDPRAEPQP